MCKLSALNISRTKEKERRVESANRLQSALFLICEQSFATFILSFKRARLVHYIFISSLTAKDEGIAHFKEILSAKDKEIVDLKVKLSELQQNRQEKDVDFAKQLKIADEQLKKTKENIFLAKENILKKKAELEKIPKEEQVYNGKWLPYKLYM